MCVAARRRFARSARFRLYPTASAIWRTPLLLIPMPAMLSARSAIDPYTPSNPTPAGPSNIAIALVRTIPIPMFRTDAPPINAEDFRISP